MARTTGHLAVSAFPVGTASLLTADGVLDSRSYLQLRNRIIEAALDQPRAVLVDVTPRGLVQHREAVATRGRHLCPQLVQRPDDQDASPSALRA